MSIINDLYKQIANDPQYKNPVKLREITKKLLNRSRVRIQTIKAKNAQTPQFLAAVKRLENAGLITPSGNVSLKLPKERKNILTVLRHVTNFLTTADTTIKGQKQRKKIEAEKRKKRNEERKKKKKETKKKQTEKIKPPQIIDEDTNFEEEPSIANIGDYWQIARDSGLVDFVGYEDFSEYVEEIYKYFDLDTFETAIQNALDNGFDSGEFWDSLSELGLGNDVDI